MHASTIEMFNPTTHTHTYICMYTQVKMYTFIHTYVCVCAYTCVSSINNEIKNGNNHNSGHKEFVLDQS